MDNKKFEYLYRIRPNSYFGGEERSVWREKCTTFPWDGYCIEGLRP